MCIETEMYADQERGGGDWRDGDHIFFYISLNKICMYSIIYTLRKKIY